MGTMYYVTCRRRKDCFELGKGGWFALKMDSPREIKKLRDGGKAAFMQHIVDAWNSGMPEEGHEEYARDVGRRLWNWCKARGWKVELMIDEAGPEDDYKITATRYKKR